MESLHIEFVNNGRRQQRGEEEEEVEEKRKMRSRTGTKRSNIILAHVYLLSSQTGAEQDSNHGKIMFHIYCCCTCVYVCVRAVIGVLKCLLPLSVG